MKGKWAFQYLFFSAFLVFFLYGCINIEPVAINVTDFSTCTNVGEAKKAFSSEEQQIFICGHVETTQPVDINIQWFFENDLVFEQFGKGIEGDFYSFLQPSPGQTFPQGNYRVKVLIGDVSLDETEFSVK